MNSAFTGFVLAGGRSRRMGSNKADLIFRGITLREHAVESLSILGGKVVIVESGDRLPDHSFPFVYDLYKSRGAPGGIHAALENCTTEFAFVLAVDLPLVTPDAVTALAAIATNAKQNAAVVPLQADGVPQPLCGIYRTAPCRKVLEELLGSDPRASVRDFLRLISPRYVEQNKLSDDPHLLFNVNSPADFDLLGRL